MPGVESFQQLTQTIFLLQLDTPRGEPNLTGYYNGFDPIVCDRYLNDLYDLAGGVTGKRVLEVGSGFGLGLVHLACHGAEAHGIELIDWQVKTCEQYLPVLNGTTIHVRQGTADELPHPDNSFDLVLSVEAISHYSDYKPFIHEAHRVLKPGGVLLISDGNNGLNPIIRRYTKRVWASHESDLPADHPFQFVRIRQRIIEQHFPDLPAHELALRTVGMTRPEIIAALTNGPPYPNNTFRGELTVHPENGMVMERLFNPYRLAQELQSIGFATRVVGHWGGASGNPLVRIADRALRTLGPVAMPTARAFRITATK